MPNKPASEEWFQKAESDLIAAENLLKDRISLNVVCFLCQQVGEKYLKSFLAYHEREIPKIHSTSRLLELCIEIDPALSELKDAAAALVPLNTETRYPGDLPEFNSSDAAGALENAKQIKVSILEKTE